MAARRSAVSPRTDLVAMWEAIKTAMTEGRPVRDTDLPPDLQRIVATPRTRTGVER